VLLNDTQFVEAQRAFAERIWQCSDDDAARIIWAFQECLSRKPSQREAVITKRVVDRERLRYANQPAAAEQLVSVGESPRNLHIPLAEHAAWTQVAAMLFNLSETITCD